MTVRPIMLAVLAVWTLGHTSGPAQAAVPGLRSCKPTTAAGVKFSGVQTNWTCRAARSILAAYARKPPAAYEATVSIGRQRYVCWLNPTIITDSGGCGAKKRRGAISFRSIRWVPPAYAQECGEVGTIDQTDAGIFEIRAAGIPCESVRQILTAWSSVEEVESDPPGWRCWYLPAPVGSHVFCRGDPHIGPPWVDQKKRARHLSSFGSRSRLRRVACLALSLPLRESLALGRRSSRSLPPRGALSVGGSR